MNNGTKEYTITWFIENYSFCWHNNGEGLKSPEFTADGLDGTVWYLQLYPRGHDDSTRSKISLLLFRNKFDDGPNAIALKYELAFLAPDGSILISRKMQCSFSGGEGYGDAEVPRIDDVLLRRKTDFLPEDILSVRCTIWIGEGSVLSSTQFNAVTRIGIEHMSFLHMVEDFSALKPNEKKIMQIESPAGGELISSSVYFSDDLCFKGKIKVEIIPSSTDIILTICKLSLLDGSGQLIEYSEVDNRFYATREDIKNLPLSLTRIAILNKKSEYLRDDKLSLLCDCTFSSKVELQKLQRMPHQIPLVALKQIHNKVLTYNAEEKLSACSNALDDFKTIYNDHLLADIELETKTKSFPAHKIVLCARSSVFKAMLTIDMKEKIMDCIQVDDVENDTVQQLLLFLYCDELENLQWESAMKLYYAGDKYNIEKLKVLCSSFLVDNLETSNAPELLLLADTHNNSDLRKFVEDYILEHEEKVFSSDEWEKLIEINPQLVIKTMHLKYKRKRGGIKS